ncbi:MAG: hypothetical protein K6G75_12230 [Lachnospiraceae bacterium]|nr:hypothetical protein [Lachnospiraceae bacterium]
MDYVNCEQKHSKTAYRALTVSGISFVSAIFGIVFIPFILSPVALIFSHLSKGRLKSKHIAAQAATVVAILALLVNVFMIGLGIYKFKTDPVVRQKINETMESMYGMSLDEYTEMIIDETRITLPEQ